MLNMDVEGEVQEDQCADETDGQSTHSFAPRSCNWSSAGSNPSPRALVGKMRDREKADTGRQVEQHGARKSTDSSPFPSPSRAVYRLEQLLTVWLLHFI